MIRRYIWLVVATLFFTFQMLVGNANAMELDQATRTVKLNDGGETLVLSLPQIKEGKRLFNYACGQCHVEGITKTDPNLDLGPALALATPRRDNVEGLVDYIKNPTTYDGLDSIAELHPSLRSADIFPKMRNLTDDDLVAISGYILLQPKVSGGKWAVGKVVR